VGHEDDVTLCDLVADRRAPTPTGAAELAVPLRSDLYAALDRKAERMRAVMEARLAAALQQLQRAADSHAMRAPALRVRDLRARLDDAARRLELRRPDAVIAQRREQVVEAERRLGRAMQQRLALAAGELAAGAARLEALSPLRVLARGFSLTTTEEGDLVHRAADLAPGDVVRTRLAEGAIRAQVLDLETDPSPAT
jgi:exodeoxyribonuclease VII large subunit